jgi:hypothetical protein
LYLLGKVIVRTGTDNYIDGIRRRCYVGLWSRLEGFHRPDLDRALERRTVVQGTLLRATIHLVSARDYWPFAVAIGTQAAHLDFRSLESRAHPPRLYGGGWSRAEI